MGSAPGPTACPACALADRRSRDERASFHRPSPRSRPPRAPRARRAARAAWQSARTPQSTRAPSARRASIGPQEGRARSNRGRARQHGRAVPVAALARDGQSLFAVHEERTPDCAAHRVVAHAPSHLQHARPVRDVRAVLIAAARIRGQSDTRTLAQDTLGSAYTTCRGARLRSRCRSCTRPGRSGQPDRRTRRSSPPRIPRHSCIRSCSTSQEPGRLPRRRSNNRWASPCSPCHACTGGRTAVVGHERDVPRQERRTRLLSGPVREAPAALHVPRRGRRSGVGRARRGRRLRLRRRPASR